MILFNYRLKEHQLFHQDETAIDFFKPEVSPVQAPIFSPTLRTHPQYLSCKVVQECFLMIEDIGPKYESDKWCGCDLVARPLQSLVEEEAAEFKLSMAASKTLRPHLARWASTPLSAWTRDKLFVMPPQCFSQKRKRCETATRIATVSSKNSAGCSATQWV